MTDDAKWVLEQLKVARRLNERYKGEVLAEMQRRANEGQLWFNDRCESWPMYERSLKELQALRDHHEV
jgi:hypothetical protein